MKALTFLEWYLKVNRKTLLARLQEWIKRVFKKLFGGKSL